MPALTAKERLIILCALTRLIQIAMIKPVIVKLDHDLIIHLPIEEIRAVKLKVSSQESIG